MEEHKKELCRMLGIENGTWAEIYEGIGKLKERAENPQKEIVYFPNTNPMPLYQNDSNLHYHNGIPCRNNPCLWC